MNKEENKQLVTLVYADSGLIKAVAVDKKRIDIFEKHMFSVYPKAKRLRIIDGDIKKRIYKDFEDRKTLHVQLKLTGWLRLTEKEFIDFYDVFPEFE